MEVKFKFKKGDIVKRKDIDSDELFVIQEAMQIKHIDWNNDGEIVTWKIENRYYLKDSFGERLKETVNECWLREYGIESEKKKEENKLPKTIYLILEDRATIGFCYSKKEAIKKVNQLKQEAKKHPGRIFKDVEYEYKEISLMEG